MVRVKSMIGDYRVYPNDSLDPPALGSLEDLVVAVRSFLQHLLIVEEVKGN